LLHGESGTGKTLAAEALAHSVSLPLLCADLSQVVSKYIGETEKQIEQLLRAAEGYRAVLFFDEADALFGNRTSVRDSHDRYANIEVDFLLQRLERFEGLVVLATNLMQNLDEAFLRRIHLAVHLARPNPALRRKLWQIHLPTQRISEDIDFDTLSRRYDMVGGDIRNVAVDASYRAASEGSKISWAHLQTALQEDFRKKGRPAPQP
jgi:SpoVK/Ycf46/Vps4 family AAA+-type ATPase